MVLIDSYKVKISIMLDNGVYLFDALSATGKSRLVKLLRKYESYGEKVATYTYEDYLRKVDISQIFNKGAKLVVIDRYDMYDGFGKLDIEKACKKEESIILIDCKQDFRIDCEYSWCNLSMTEDKIEVFA